MRKTGCLNRLRVVMADKMLTNKWLAEQMGMSEITISRWRSNKLQPSLAQLVEISRILKVEVQDLIEMKYKEESTQMTEIKEKECDYNRSNHADADNQR